MRKIIVSLAAAGVLVAGAFVASTIASSEASAQTDETSVAIDDARPNRGAVLDGVLDDLVTDGTLDQSQADAVKDALVAKHEEIRENREERRANRAERRERFEAWLEDGVITADELAELDVELPLHEDGPLAEALEDGKITQAEWDAFVEERGDHHKARRGASQNSVTG